MELLNGSVLRGAQLTYEVHGTPNADRSNVVLHPTSFGAAHPDLRYRIGSLSAADEGEAERGAIALDTDKWCVVVVNMLGNGQSSSPVDRRPDAPQSGADGSGGRIMWGTTVVVIEISGTRNP